MTIYSMTAFARSELHSKEHDLVCEIRSINHRYLEISVHLPEALRVFEMPIREALRKQLQRGKVDCVLRYRTSDDLDQQLKLNVSLAKKLSKEADKVSTFLKAFTPPNPSDILRFPGVLEAQEINASMVETPLLTVVATTTKQLVAARKREGEDLHRFFLSRIESIEQELAKINEVIPRLLKQQKDQLRKRFLDAKVEVNPERLEQELVIYAQKLDITEEILRTETHIAEFRRILKQGGAIGRRLDFLLQELNREVNTIGSKSVNSKITHSAVEIKVLIEQIREQVQNIE